jgi:drug/metabolite transporter (DMT)-like permease
MLAPVPRQEKHVSRRSAHKPVVLASGYETSIPRTVIAAALALVGIVWIVVYINVAKDAATYIPGTGKKPSNPIPFMADLDKWNFLIGFGLIFAGLIVAANKKTPLGRGRGVVIGMLGCFLIGLVWIVLYYFSGSDSPIPVMKDLGQYNLMLGIGFMAVGFAYATKWE